MTVERNAFRATAIVTMVTIASVVCAQAQQMEPLTFLKYCIKVQRPVLTKMATSKKLSELDAVFDHLPYHDPVSRMVYSYVRYTIHDDAKSERLLIRAIPANPLEFNYCGTLSELRIEDEQEDPVLAHLFDDYVTATAHAVLKTGSGFRDFLRLRGFADGSVAEDLDDDDEFLLEHDRKRFIRAFMSLDKQTQEQICGDWREPFCPK